MYYTVISQLLLIQYFVHLLSERHQMGRQCLSIWCCTYLEQRNEPLCDRRHCGVISFSSGGICTLQAACTVCHSSAHQFTSLSDVLCWSLLFTSRASSLQAAVTLSYLFILLSAASRINLLFLARVFGLFFCLIRT